MSHAKMSWKTPCVCGVMIGGASTLFGLWSLLYTLGCRSGGCGPGPNWVYAGCAGAWLGAALVAWAWWMARRSEARPSAAPLLWLVVTLIGAGLATLAVGIVAGW